MTTHTPRGPYVRRAEVDATDPRAVVIEVAVPGHGVLTSTYEFDTEAQARARLSAAADATLDRIVNGEPWQVGETRRVTRHETPLGTLYVGILRGPPTWRLPRTGLRRRRRYVEVMAGWWRLAIVVGWGTSRRSRRSRDR